MIPVQGTAYLLGTGVLTGTGAFVAQGDAALTGEGSLAGTGVYVAQGEASLSGDGSLTASAWAPFNNPIEISGAPALYSEPMFSDIIFADFGSRTAGGRLTQPGRPGVLIKFFDKDDVLQGVISTNTGRCILSKMDFDLLDTGPGKFDLTLAADPSSPILHEYRMDIHLWNDPEPYYSGAVQSIPWTGSTDRTRQYTGFGYSEHLNRILIDGTWENKYPWEIVRDILRDQIAPNTKVLLDDSQIARSTEYLVSRFVLQRASAKDTLRQLAALAGGAKYGVDHRRRFFWKAEATEVTEHLWQGKHVGGVTGELDAAKIVNRQWIKLGSIRTDLAPTDPFLKTNWLIESLEDTDSQALYGRRDNVFQAPSMLDALDAVRAASIDMAAKSVPSNPIRLKDVFFDGTRITAEGLVRIVGVGGAELTLPKKKANYRISGSRVQLDLELGELERSPAEWISELAAKQSLEQLSRQQSQTQF